MLKTALIGCGGISAVHFDVLKHMDDVQLIAVADIIPERAEAVQGAKPYTDWKQMLEQERPEVLHICTPHYLHVPMAQKAMAMGIHVLTEKPCAMTLQQLADLREAQKNSQAQLGVCFQNRYNPSSRYLKKVTETKEYGALLGARAFVTWQRGADYFNSAVWRGTLAQEGGGVIINQAIHTVDLIGFLCGELRAVTAHTGNDTLQGVIEVEDTAMALLEFAGGRRGLFYATLAHAEDAPVFVELRFEQAALRLEGDNIYLYREDGSVERVLEQQAEQSVGKSYWGSGHRALIRDFYDCVAEGRHFEIDAFEGGKAVEAVLSIYESAATNTRCVL